ncbi:hypothetical protein D3C75_1373150 [compost metagenome]
MKLYALEFDALIGQRKGKRRLMLLGCQQLAHLSQFEPHRLGRADHLHQRQVMGRV